LYQLDLEKQAIIRSEGFFFRFQGTWREIPHGKFGLIINNIVNLFFKDAPRIPSKADLSLYQSVSGPWRFIEARRLCQILTNGSWSNL